MFPEDGVRRYTVDVRIFVVLLLAAMAVSFGVGMGITPIVSEYLQTTVLLSSDHAARRMTAKNAAALPPFIITSVPWTKNWPASLTTSIVPPASGVGSDDLGQEPVGQVRGMCVCVCVCV